MIISEFVEVIIKIFEGLHKNPNPEKVVELISRENIYNKKVLAAAYSWIYDKAIRDVLNKKSKDENNPGVRVSSPEEVQMIGLENVNYLMHFYLLGIINNRDLEFILDQLMLFPESSVNKEKIDTLIFSLFLDLDNYVLPGSRCILYSSDKIN